MGRESIACRSPRAGPQAEWRAKRNGNAVRSWLVSTTLSPVGSSHPPEWRAPPTLADSGANESLSGSGRRSARNTWPRRDRVPTFRPKRVTPEGYAENWRGRPSGRFCCDCPGVDSKNVDTMTDPNFGEAAYDLRPGRGCENGRRERTMAERRRRPASRRRTPRSRRTRSGLRRSPRSGGSGSELAFIERSFGCPLRHGGSVSQVSGNSR